MQRPRAVLFDLDGTLVDSAVAIAAAWTEWGRCVGLGDGFVFDRHGVPARDVVWDLLPADQAEAGLILVNELELVTLDGIVPIPGALRLVAALDAAGIPWAVVTSCTRALAEARAGAAGIRLPPVTVTADDVSRGKPEPDGYERAALGLGVPPGDCAVVEDSPAGIRAGLQAGCSVFGVTSTHPAAALTGARTVATLDRLIPMLSESP